MTTDGTLAAIAAQGLQVNNCFQLDSGAWRVHLRRPGIDLPVGYAAGATLAEALHGAFLNAMAASPRQKPAEPRQIDLPLSEDVFA